MKKMLFGTIVTLLAIHSVAGTAVDYSVGGVAFEGYIENEGNIDIPSIYWDTKQGGFKAHTELRIGNIILQSKPLFDYDETLKIKAISDAIKKEGAWLLDFNAEVTQWQNRVNSQQQPQNQDKLESKDYLHTNRDKNYHQPL